MIQQLFDGMTDFMERLIRSKPGQTLENPLEIKAVPGLMTLLDVALLRTVEPELTGTLSSSHALLVAWLEVKQQARIVLQLVSQEGDLPPNLRPKANPGMAGAGGGSNVSNSTSNSILTSNYLARKSQVESFARACFDGACDAIERMSTEKLAHTANLSDPFEHHFSGAPTFGGNSSLQAASTTGSSHHGASSGLYGNDSVLSTAVQDSLFDSGRRIPTGQRGKDCWESPRLHCPDYVWADETCETVEKILQYLGKHPFVTSFLADQANGGMSGGTVEPPTMYSLLVTLGAAFFSKPATSSSNSALARQITLSRETEREATLLIQILLVDISTRLIQFRACTEAESVVTKRLFLVKSEYRAPFRAFLEAHQSVQRAPSLRLMESFGKQQSPGRKVMSIAEDRLVVAKDRLQKLLETPALVEVLALERRCEEYEVGMAVALYPFAELARFLDQKKATTRNVPGVLFDDPVQLMEVRQLLQRLRAILVRKAAAGPETSVGIRPILLDLQGVPLDEDVIPERNVRVGKQDRFRHGKAEVEARVEKLIGHLRILSKCCEHKSAFRTERKNEVEPPVSVSAGCKAFDHELFSCQFLDWYDGVVRQEEIVHREKGFERLAEQIRKAEMQISLEAANEQALDKVRQRVELITRDRSKRFEILKEILEDLCLREMDLHICLEAPGTDEVLDLLPTSALGVFGLPLRAAGEILPIG